MRYSVGVMAAGAATRSRVTLERKKSDFGPGAFVNAYTGSGCCCCCCCLHWIGAVAGGIAGGKLGWKSGVRRPIWAEGAEGGPPFALTVFTTRAVQKGFRRGIIFSVLGTGVMFLLALYSESFWIPLMALAVVPSLFFVPAIATTVLGVVDRGARLRSLYTKELRKLSEPKALPDAAYRAAPLNLRVNVPELTEVAMFCTSCWAPIVSGDVRMRCASCSEPLLAPAIPEHRWALRLAWHVTGKTLLWSTIGTMGAYAFMWLLVMLFK
jgi:hypothetical protein